MFNRIRSDIQAVFDRDPAAKSITEVLLCYPGVHAIWAHRAAHWLYRHGFFLPARIVSQLSRHFTGIEIHPGAEIGEGLFIDHGAGVVIGETTVIGQNVTLFQGVTLGGTGKEKGKRHPTIGDNVTIAAGAKILGSFKVGDGAKVGAGAVVLHPVPPNATVVGVPGRVVMRDGVRVGADLEHDKIPDPIALALENMQRRLEALERQLAGRDDAKQQEEAADGDLPA